MNPGDKLRNVVAALDEEPPTDEEAREAVARLGVDIPSLAARIRARAARAPATDAERRVAELRLAHEEAEMRARARAREPEPVRPRAEQIARVRALLDRAARTGRSAGIAAHFRNFEEAGDDELRELCTALRDLVEDEGGGDPER
jgi:hypothetical protein